MNGEIMENISVINCTPHHVSLSRHLLEGLAVFGVCPSPSAFIHHEHLGEMAYRFEPSGIRLAAMALTSGPALGCSVEYVSTAEAREEMERLKNIFGECQGSRHLVLASEISCRAMAPHIWDGSMASSIEMMWPVLAHESLRLPMAQRWADRLATLTVPADLG